MKIVTYFARPPLLALVFAASFYAGPAGAQGQRTDSTGALPEAPEESRAEQLFREGRELFKQGNTKEACSKFEESAALDPSPGTRLNLAICILRQGKPTAARRLLIALQKEITPEDPRSGVFQHEMAEAERQIARITLRISGKSDCILHIDRRAVGPAFSGRSVELDPGTHHFGLVCKTGESPERTLEVGVGARTELVMEPKATVVPRAPASPAARMGSTEREPTPHRASPLRTPAWMLAGAGTLALVSALVNGVLVLDRKREMEKWCPDSACRDERGMTAAGEGQAYSTLATGSFAVGLLFTIPSITWLLLDGRRVKP